MILPVHTQLRDRIAAALASLYEIDREAMPTIVLEYPPNRRLGDLAVTVAFELARTLHKAPRVIAREIAESIGDLGGIGRVEPTSAGYLNVFLNRTVFARIRLTDGGGSTEQKNAPKADPLPEQVEVSLTRCFGPVLYSFFRVKNEYFFG